MRETKHSRPLAEPKVNANGSKNPTLSFRVRGDLYDRLRAQAEADGYSLSEAIERRLLKSFELERHIDMQQQTERLLWPDESARILGQGFAMALAAARHASGQDWREDRSASLIVAGAVRRLMDRCSRDGASMVAELFDGARIAGTADRIVETVGPCLDKAMPSLPDRMFDVVNWTGRCFHVNEFRDAATGEVLETVTGPEWDAADPEQRGDFGDGYMAAIARFKPIREKVDAETFVVHVLKDGMHKRISHHLTPAGPGPKPQAAPVELSPETSPAEPTGAEPTDEGDLRLIGMEAAGRDAHNWRTPRGMLPSSLDDQAIHDEAVGELPLVQAERAEAAQHREKAPLDVGAGSPEATATKGRGRNLRIDHSDPVPVEMPKRERRSPVPVKHREVPPTETRRRNVKV